jgi:osmotically inducible protein OsmC
VEIMPERTGSAEWRGNLREGKGTVSFGSGPDAYQGAYGFVSRFEEGEGTNPEELIGAAHAGCFSMALAANLTRAGFEPESIRTKATVSLERVDEAWTITVINIETQATVPDLEDGDFQEHVKAAKKNCPVSRALAGVAVEVTATLRS